MVSGGPKPPRLTSSKTIGYATLVRNADPDFTLRSKKLPEYEVTSNRKRGGVKIFEGYYQSRGPYRP